MYAKAGLPHIWPTAGRLLGDSTLFLLQTAYSLLESGSGHAMIMFDLSGTFNTIQPLFLRQKMVQMEMDPCLVS